MKLKKLGKAGIKATTATACGAGAAIFLDAAMKNGLPFQFRAIMGALGGGMAIGASMLGADAVGDTVSAFKNEDE